MFELPRLLLRARAGDVTLVVVPIESHVEGSTRFPEGDPRDFQWPWSPAEPIAELDDRQRARALVTVAKAIVDGVASRVEPASVSVARERLGPMPTRMTSQRLGPLHGVPAFPPHHAVF